MDIRPDIQIQSMIKAMVDVVLPAVDPEHKMAQEQARLVIGTLHLIAKRLPLAYRYDCDELHRYVDFARELIGLTAEMGGAIDPDTRGRLEGLAAWGSELLEGARSDPSEIEAAILELRAVVGLFIRDTNNGGPAEARKELRRRVLAMSRHELERELALVVDMGFQVDPANPPAPIEEQLPLIRRRAES